MGALGPWTLASSPAIEVPSGSSLRLTHGDSDWVILGPGHAGTSRQLRTSLGPAADTSFATPGNAANGQPRIAFYSSTHGAVVIDGAGASFVGGGRLTMPLRVHHNATFTEVDVYFKVGSSHSGGVPTNVPQMRVIRLDTLGNAVPLCNNPAESGWLGNGWLTMTSATTGPGYYGGGAVQYAPYPIDSGLQLVDVSQYTYFVQVIDESGSNAQSGNDFFEALAKFSAIPDIRPQ